MLQLPPLLAAPPLRLHWCSLTDSSAACCDSSELLTLLLRIQAWSEVLHVYIHGLRFLGLIGGPRNTGPALVSLCLCSLFLLQWSTQREKRAVSRLESSKHKGSNCATCHQIIKAVHPCIILLGWMPQQFTFLVKQLFSDSTSILAKQLASTFLTKKCN